MKVTGRRWLAHGVFTVFVIGSLTTPSWRYGPFSWWPLWSVDNLAGGPVSLGALNLLPAILALLWLIGVARERVLPRLDVAFTLPFLAFSVWSLLRLGPAAPRLLFISGGAFTLAWLTYLFVVSEHPLLTPPLTVVVIIQTVVGVGQFLRQGDLGLRFLGELPLNPAFEGVTVLFARQQPWLRAYGLTAHPNLLGALLAVAIVLLFPALSRSTRWGRRILLLTITIGGLGLFVSFSRAAWLGFGLGLLVWMLDLERPFRAIKDPERVLLFLIPLLLLLILAIFYGDLVRSRFLALDQPLEARSIGQRLKDAQVAFEIFTRNPLSGSGLGTFVDAAQPLGNNVGRVHNVFLLVAAELGIVGLALATLLLFLPPLSLFRLCRANRNLACAAGLSPWLVMLTVNQLDTTLWITSNWQTAIVFGLVAGNYVNCRKGGTPAAP